MNMHLKVTREIPLTKVERLWNGPSLRGVKPVLVCFQLFKDKEEVLRKSNMLLKVELCNARWSADGSIGICSTLHVKKLHILSYGHGHYLKRVHKL